MFRRNWMVVTFVVSVLFGVGSGGCFADETLVLYSGRSKKLVQPILDRFKAESGIEVKVKYGKTAQLVLALEEEGDHSSADLFWAQDAGALGALTERGMFQELPEAILSQVPDYLHSSQATWIATSARARVLAYAPSRVQKDELPASVLDLADPKWKDRIGWAPSNASFQAFVTAMRLKHGQERTKQWLIDVKHNGAKTYAKNTPILQALAAGEIDLGLPNHYYLLRFKKADADFPVAQTFFESGDVGNLVNVAGIGVLKSSKNTEMANKLVAFLLEKEAQEFFTSEVFEYPVRRDVAPHSGLEAFDDLDKNALDVDLNSLKDLEGTLELLREVGLL